MQIQAVAKSVRMSPRKVRLVADMIRKMSIDEAVAALEGTPKRAGIPLNKALNSAIANAVNNAKLDRTSLMIESINISEGPALKRFHPSTRGRIHSYKRRSSNIKIVLKTKEAKAGTKAVDIKKADEPKKDEAQVKQDVKKTNPLKKLLKGGKK